jgi:hypothetical protein
MSAFEDFAERELRELYTDAGGDADELEARVAAKVREALAAHLADLLADREVRRLTEPMRTDLIDAVKDLTVDEMRAKLARELDMFLWQNDDEERCSE